MNATKFLVRGKEPQLIRIKDLNIPLFDAKSAEQLAFLVNAGADVNVRHKKLGTTRLHTVKSVEEARVLVDAGIDMNVTDKRGNTALYYHAGEIKRNNRIFGECRSRCKC